MTQPMTDDELRKAQEREYGTYVATEQIFVGNALAFDVGHKVPISHVEGYPDPDNPGQKLPPVVREDQVRRVRAASAPEPGGAPSKSAPKAEWEAHARGQGASDEQLASLTKDELIAQFGS